MNQKRIALVTGASRGIGKAIALALARQGCEVIGTATTEKGAESITQYFSENSLNGVGKLLNVNDNNQIINLVDTIKLNHGIIEILVNNAAIARDNLMMRMKDDEWNDVINTNLNAVYYMIKACLCDMIKNRWGRIVNISSIVGMTGNAGQANYVASKAGLIGLTKSLALETATRGITVNAIAPGYIETDMTLHLPDEWKAEIIKKIPMNRSGQPEDVANLATFLASDQAAYITGQTIHVNGGMLMG